MTNCQWPYTHCDKPIFDKRMQSFCEKHLREWDSMNRKHLQEFIDNHLKKRFESE